MTPIDQPLRTSRDLEPIGDWCLDPEGTFLNHGSFGALPASVKEHQDRLRDRFSSAPAAFFASVLDRELDSARVALADFVGATPSALGFVSNATSGVNAVLRSLTLEPGDEVVVTDHGYAACSNALSFVAQRWGARVVVAAVPFPIDGPGHVMDAVMGVLSNKTRLVLIDHITSPTGLVLPVDDLVAALNGRGIDTLVDGAHAPGQLPLQLDALGAAYYTGNCHKWLCAPQGAAFLYVRPDRQAGIHPVSIGHAYGKQRSGRSMFVEAFDWPGTDDPTAWLSVPVCIEHIGGMVAGGWPAVMDRNRTLVLDARRRLCERFGTEPMAPESMVGTMACVETPLIDRFQRTWHGDTGPIHDWLWETHRIDAVTVPWPGYDRAILRLSAHLYNAPEQYDRLADALAEYPGFQSK